MQGTVLIAHNDDAYLEATVCRLSDMGFHVIGPAKTAALALALIAQTPARLAIIGERLDGRRNGRTLASLLKHHWGLRSVIVPSVPTQEADDGTGAWPDLLSEVLGRTNG